MKRRILLFENDNDLRSLLAGYLKSRGFHVSAFESPHAFYAKSCGSCREATSCGYAILSDVRMPELSGIDFVRLLQSRGCPIRNLALMSGMWSRPDLELASHLGCHVFRKPFSLREVAQWLGGPLPGKRV